MEALGKYYFSKVSVAGLERLRIALCAFLLIPYLGHFSDPEIFLSFQGQFFGWVIPPAANSMLLFCLIVGLIFAMLGFQTRGSLAVSTVLHSFFAENGYYPMWGWGSFATLLLITMTLSHSSSKLSLDFYLFPLRRRSLSWVLPIRWLQLQMGVMYLSICLKRLPYPDWRNGQALQGILESRIFSRLAYLDLSPFSKTLEIFNYLGWGLELLGGFALFAGMRGRWIAAMMILLHMTLLLVAPVGQWQTLIILGWLTFFLVSRSEPEALTLKTSQRLISALMVVFSFSLYLLAFFPGQSLNRWLSNHWVGRGLLFSMMDRRPINSVCLFVDEIKGARLESSIYKMDHERCFDSKFYLMDDPVQHAVTRDNIRLFGKSQRLDLNTVFGRRRALQIKERMARSFCALSAPPPEGIQMFVVGVPTKKSSFEDLEWNDYGRWNCQSFKEIERQPENFVEWTQQRKNDVRRWIEKSR